MKKRLMCVLLAVLASSAFAELRLVAISCNAIVKKDSSGIKKLTFKYSLHTGTKKEEVKGVTLKELLPKLKGVKSSDSSIKLFIFSNDTLNIKTLKSLLSGIGKNPHMVLVYLENGKSNKQADRIKKYYKI